MLSYGEHENLKVHVCITTKNTAYMQLTIFFFASRAEISRGTFLEPLKILTFRVNRNT